MTKKEQHRPNINCIAKAMLCLTACLLFVQCRTHHDEVPYHDLSRDNIAKRATKYSNMRLLDIYKSCFQDFMGAEHLVSDRERVKAYLDEELSATNLDDLSEWYYEPCGTEGRYVRVSLRTIKEKLISEDMLIDAFIRSANMERPSVKSWERQWNKIVRKIDRMALNLPNYEADKQFIDSVLSVGKYAISHSPEYREANHPHYRIIERSIFDRELKPLIDNSPPDDKSLREPEPPFKNLK